jgi:hypothetical protein
MPAFSSIAGPRYSLAGTTTFAQPRWPLAMEEEERFQNGR